MFTGSDVRFITDNGSDIITHNADPWKTLINMLTFPDSIIDKVQLRLNSTASVVGKGTGMCQQEQNI